MCVYIYMRLFANLTGPPGREGGREREREGGRKGAREGGRESERERASEREREREFMERPGAALTNYPSAHPKKKKFNESST
jgi:hypothetical protein